MTKNSRQKFKYLENKRSFGGSEFLERWESDFKYLAYSFTKTDWDNIDPINTCIKQQKTQKFLYSTTLIKFENRKLGNFA